MPDPSPLRALPRPADQEVISLLERLLDQAKLGELSGIVWCSSDNAGQTQQGYAGMVWTARMIGSIEILKATIIKDCA